METSDLPQGHAPEGLDANDDDRLPRSQSDETLVKSSIWNKQTLRDIEYNRALAANESKDHDTQRLRFIKRLCAQLDERNDEIERLRDTLSKLKEEHSRLGRVHKQEAEQSRAELERLKDAYDQFEKESDSLVAELSQENQRLLDECRHRNSRLLPKT